MLQPQFPSLCIKSLLTYVAQKRALETYFKRIYHPFMLRLPSWHQLPCGFIVLWTHSDPRRLASQPDKPLLGVAVVVPSVQELLEALNALPQVTSELGTHLL